MKIKKVIYLIWYFFINAFITYFKKINFILKEFFIEIQPSNVTLEIGLETHITAIINGASASDFTFEWFKTNRYTQEETSLSSILINIF